MFFGVTDKIPHDEEIAGEPKLVDHPKLDFKSLFGLDELFRPLFGPVLRISPQKSP